MSYLRVQSTCLSLGKWASRKAKLKGVQTGETERYDLDVWDAGFYGLSTMY